MSNLESLVEKLVSEKWKVTIRSSEQYGGYTCVLMPNHMNFNTSPYGQGSTMLKAVQMAMLDAKQRYIFIQ